MAMFKAFKPAAMNKIAQAMGYQGDMNQFQQFIEGDPARQARMQQFTNAAQQMAKGGMVRKMQTGGDVTAQTAPPAAPAPQSDVKNVAIGDVSTQRMYAPGIPQGGVTTAAMTPTGPALEVQQGTGALTGAVAVPTAMAGTATASPQQE